MRNIVASALLLVSIAAHPQATNRYVFDDVRMNDGTYVDGWIDYSTYAGTAGFSAWDISSKWFRYNSAASGNWISGDYGDANNLANITFAVSRSIYRQTPAYFGMLFDGSKFQAASQSVKLTDFYESFQYCFWYCDYYSAAGANGQLLKTSPPNVYIAWGQSAPLEYKVLKSGDPILVPGAMVAAQVDDSTRAVFQQSVQAAFRRSGVPDVRFVNQASADAMTVYITDTNGPSGIFGEVYGGVDRGNRVKNDAIVLMTKSRPLSDPKNSLFMANTLAHEIGHALGAPHTLSGSVTDIMNDASGDLYENTPIFSSQKSPIELLTKSGDAAAGSLTTNTFYNIMRNGYGYSDTWLKRHGYEAGTYESSNLLLYRAALSFDGLKLRAGDLGLTDLYNVYVLRKSDSRSGGSNDASSVLAFYDHLALNESAGIQFESFSGELISIQASSTSSGASDIFFADAGNGDATLDNFSISDSSTALGVYKIEANGTISSLASVGLTVSSVPELSLACYFSVGLFGLLGSFRASRRLKR